MGGSARICILFLFLEVTYEIGERLELQAVFICILPLAPGKLRSRVF
jgi:hypothetical protein